jgi:hypothetical protein
MLLAVPWPLAAHSGIRMAEACFLPWHRAGDSKAAPVRSRYDQVNCMLDNTEGRKGKTRFAAMGLVLTCLLELRLMAK